MAATSSTHARWVWFAVPAIFVIASASFLHACVSDEPSVGAITGKVDAGGGGGGGDAGALVCGADEKPCGPGCVKLADPLYGCTPSGCESCRAFSVETYRCAAGACKIASCTPGREDCDGTFENGCEDQLSASPNCGKCMNTCLPAAPNCGPLDAGFGCVLGCAAPQEECNKKCTIKATDVSNCGTCGLVCPSSLATDGQATCIAGKCGLKCLQGMVPDQSGRSCVKGGPGVCLGTNVSCHQSNQCCVGGCPGDTTCTCEAAGQTAFYGCCSGIRTAVGTKCP
jgi:hypothetical protein